MIGQNPVTAADLDIVGTLSPTLTPRMTKLFRRLCDRAQANILRAKWAQRFYHDVRHVTLSLLGGTKFGSAADTFPMSPPALS